MMTSLHVCADGKVSWCHLRRWKVLALSILPLTRAIIVHPSPLHPAINLAGILAEWQHIPYFRECGKCIITE